ncbi:MAG: antibiotic ABC transporter permease, partial [Desulfatitalea sp.]
MLRDPRMRVVIFAMPVVQLTVLAFALTTDVKNIRTAVLDEDRTPISRQVAAEFEGGGYFKIIAFLPSNRAMAQWLDAGQ